MTTKTNHRRAVVAFAAALALAGCQGEKGPQGDQGSAGGDGLPGQPGAHVTQLGKFTGKVTAGTAGLAGATVSTVPDQGAVAITDSTGAFTLAVPAGTYVLNFAADNYAPASLAGQVIGVGETKALATQALTASPLVVTVTLPEAIRTGKPAGFGVSTGDISASATLNGAAVTPDSVTWSVKEYYGIAAPPAAVTLSAASGATTSFTVPSFEQIREGANSWLRNRWNWTPKDPSDPPLEYIRLPGRDGLLAFGTQQVRAMSFQVKATVKYQGYTSTKTQVVSPVTISTGHAVQPIGMMVVATTGKAGPYAWTLEKMDGTDGTYAAEPGLMGTDTATPTFIPTTTGVYKLSGGDAPIYFRAAAYVGVPSNTCTGCHTGSYDLQPKFDEWEASAHANFYWKDPFTRPQGLFEAAINGLEGNRYATSGCAQCHTVGNSPANTVPNGGFDDVDAALTNAWDYPDMTTKDDGRYASNVPAALKKLGNIQCENCHGPLSTDHASPQTGGHPTFGLVAPKASFDSGLCATCHDAFTHHDRSALWLAAGHSNLTLAVEDATIENRGIGANHCGRCHAGQGFVEYLPQQQAGNPVNIGECSPTLDPANCTCTPSGTATTCSLTAATCTPGAAYDAANEPLDPACPCKPTAPATTCSGDATLYARLESAGLTKAEVQPQTCQTCHDPHSTELRLKGDSGLTAALFEVPNAGAGAMCIVCHNSRSNQVRQGTTTLSSWTAPHTASQADVYAGRNAFFVPNLTNTTTSTLPYLTKHSFMSESCADCHVKWVGEDLKKQYGVYNTNHTFKGSKEVCAECHASGIAELVQEANEEKLHAIAVRLGVLFRNKLNTGFDAVERMTWPEEDAITVADPTIAANQVRGVELHEAHGQPALLVTLVDGSQFISQIRRFCTTNNANAGQTACNSGQSLFPTTGVNQTAVKAYYNYLYVEGDGTAGLHNPSFVRTVLDETLTQVNGLASLL